MKVLRDGVIAAMKRKVNMTIMNTMINYITGNLKTILIITSKKHNSIACQYYEMSKLLKTD